MHLQSRIFLWSQAIILISLCFIFNFAAPFFHGPKANKDHIHKTIYVDRRFNDDEVTYIAQAAITWTLTTNHIATLDVVRLPTHTIIDATDAVLILKVSPDFPEIILLDGQSHSDSTVGYFQEKSVIPYIEIVSSRLNDNDYKPVVMHEMGHALGLEHITGEKGIGTLMYPSVDYNNGEITNLDLEQFCKLYHCDPKKLEH